MLTCKVEGRFIGTAFFILTACFSDLQCTRHKEDRGVKCYCPALGLLILLLRSLAFQHRFTWNTHCISSFILPAICVITMTMCLCVKVDKCVQVFTQTRFSLACGSVKSGLADHCILHHLNTGLSCSIPAAAYMSSGCVCVCVYPRPVCLLCVDVLASVY